MERSEPTLVPKWLKNAVSSTSGGSTTHTGSERTTSSYFHRSSSSNGSGNSRSYSNFGRNQRYRDWAKDNTYDYRYQDKSTKGEHERRYLADPPGNNTSVSKFDRDGLRRSHSMVSDKPIDTLPKKDVTDLIDANGKNTDDVVNRVSPISGVVSKGAFERDFPSLGAEERAVTPEAGRVPSPSYRFKTFKIHLRITDPGFYTENNVVRAQLAELTDRRRSLNSVLQIASEVSGFAFDIQDIPDNLLEPWQLPCPVHPIPASADMFGYW
ncbi:hypothetical protein CASFOL_026385 [Castilleja foliolosa]|uniref:Uncharacterized protein n=1 Tax=Castilleja foliolosa TaxID=1961234 RepID=A0ABD3CHS1_9LAMI